MKCNEIQDLILTDYIDKEADKQLSAEITQHLKHCQACREFLQIAEAAVIKPFESLNREQPGEEVWQNIKSQIDLDEDAAEEGLLSRWRKIIMPYFVPALGLYLLCMAFIGVFGQSSDKVQSPTAENGGIEQIEYFASLTDLDEDESLGEFADYIEEYFL